MTPDEQDILRESLEKTCDAFFRKRAARKSKLVLANGHASDAPIDATGLLVVLSGWVGDLIGGAPEEMRDDLFLSFADTVVDVAGIKAEAEEAQESALPAA